MYIVLITNSIDYTFVIDDFRETDKKVKEVEVDGERERGGVGGGWSER